MRFRKIMILAVGLLFTSANVGVSFACDEECKPGEIYSDKQELCVPASPQTPKPAPKPLT